MHYLANRVKGFGTTIFTEMTALAVEHQAVNLGQGFPDFAAPDFVKEAARAAIAAGDLSENWKSFPSDSGVHFAIVAPWGK